MVGNLVEQLWNFAWPASIALIHPSLLPVAVMGFFAKVSVPTIIRPSNLGSMELPIVLQELMFYVKTIEMIFIIFLFFIYSLKKTIEMSYSHRES